MQMQNSKLIALEISDAVIEGEELWSFCDEFNGLLYANLKSGKVQILDSFPELPFSIYHAFGSVVKVDEILVFVPGIADAVYTYHIRKKKFKLFPLPKEMPQILGKLKFNQAVVHEDSVFMLGYSQPCIVRFDVTEEHMIYYGEWYQDYLRMGFGHEILLMDKEICVLESKIYFPPRNGDCIIEFDMKKCQCIFHDFNYVKDWYCSLYYDDGFFWTCGTKNRTIIRMNDRFEVVEELSLRKVEPGMGNIPLMEGDAYFRFSYKKGDFIWLFSDRFTKYIQVDIVKRKVSVHSYSDYGKYDVFSFANMKCTQNGIYIFEPLRKRLYIYSEEMKRMKVFRFEVDQNDIFGCLDASVVEYFLYEKEKYINLNYLIWQVQIGTHSYKEKNMTNNGAEILELCKRGLTDICF